MEFSVTDHTMLDQSYKTYYTPQSEIRKNENGETIALFCKICDRTRGSHNSIQRTHPHKFVEGKFKKVIPSEIYPHYEGGFSMVN